jgi:hypothetical protein
MTQLWNNFTEIENVFTNVSVPRSDQPYLFERSFLYRVIRILTEWQEFKNYKFFLLDSRREHEFKLDKKSIVFYLSNENHVIPDYLKTALVVFTPYYPRNASNNNMYSIPLGVNGSVPFTPFVPFDQRKIDVFFSGNLHRRRIPFFFVCLWLKIINKVSKWIGRKPLNMYIRFTRRFAAGLSPEEYGKMLSETKIALTPEGYDSNISFRFFEAARTGCILVSCRQPDVWHYDRFPGYYVSSWTKLPAIIRNLVKNPEHAELMHQRILEYYRTYCSEESLANYIKQVISKQMEK